MGGARWAIGSGALATVRSLLHRKPVEISLIGHRAAARTGTLEQQIGLRTQPGGLAPATKRA